jgi:hypothetical protein
MLFVTAVFIAVSVYPVLPSFAEEVTLDLDDPYGSTIPPGTQGCYKHTRKPFFCRDVGPTTCARIVITTEPDGVTQRRTTYGCNQNNCTCEVMASYILPKEGNTEPTQTTGADSLQQMTV